VLWESILKSWLQQSSLCVFILAKDFQFNSILKRETMWVIKYITYVKANLTMDKEQGDVVLSWAASSCMIPWFSPTLVSCFPLYTTRWRQKDISTQKIITLELQTLLQYHLRHFITMDEWNLNKWLTNSKHNGGALSIVYSWTNLI
jgi:hypothetical protein